MNSILLPLMVNGMYNNQGAGAVVQFITSDQGTGNWEEYAILYRCGATSGDTDFSTGGHVYISAGPDMTAVTWYLAYVNTSIITDHEELINYTVLGNKDKIDGGTFASRQFNECNLYPNGDGAKQDTAFLPSGWTWDTTDVAGNATASVVQGVGVSTDFLPIKIAVVPNQCYKISFWIKCKQDMSKFLVTVGYYTANNKLLSHVDVTYVNNTKTQLTQALTAGDTVMYVKSNANWIARDYSALGFRSNSTIGYHDIGRFSNDITGVVNSVTSTNQVNLKIAYSGTTRAKDTWVVESYNGANWHYPIQKSALPTDNT